MKNIIIFHLKILVFTSVKYCSILHRRVHDHEFSSNAVFLYKHADFDLYPNVMWIYTSLCMTSLLKLEITVGLSGLLCQFIQRHCPEED